MEMNEQESYAAIEALEECIHTCQDCASHDIRHGGEMATCALLNLDCADICAATSPKSRLTSAANVRRSAPSTITSIANDARRRARKRRPNSTSTRANRICNSETSSVPSL